MTRAPLPLIWAPGPDPVLGSGAEFHFEVKFRVPGRAAGRSGGPGRRRDRDHCHAVTQVGTVPVTVIAPPASH